MVGGGNGHRYERYFGRKAYAHLFVTKAMRDWVVSSWQLEFVLPPFFPFLPPHNRPRVR